jgi:hypothetical protein
MPSPLASVELPLRELIFALDAAAVLALSPWTPGSDKTIYFAKPLLEPPPELDPRERVRQERERQRMFEEQRLELDRMRPDLPVPSVEPTSKEEVIVLRESTSVAGSIFDDDTAGEPAPPPRQQLQVSKAVDYERILGAFTIDADVLILLDPATVEAYADPRWVPSARRALAAIGERLKLLGAKRHLAVAQLDEGALAWADGDAEGAYGAIMAAQRAFAEAGDARGLAHAHAWLAHLFDESGEPAIAAEHRWVSEQLFSRLTSATR